VRRAGFAYRAPFQKFMDRYVALHVGWMLSTLFFSKTNPGSRGFVGVHRSIVNNRYFLISKQCSYAAQRIWKGDDISGSKAILADNYIGNDQYQIGKTKIFIRHPETVPFSLLV
jgi:myosin-1